MFEYNTVEEAVKDLQDGKLILVSDDESRENEGDLICAAEFATTENVNFMATYMHAYEWRFVQEVRSYTDGC